MSALTYRGTFELREVETRVRGDYNLGY